MHTLYFPSQVLGYSSDKANLVPPLKGIISVGDNQRNTNHFNYSEQWIFNSGIDYTGNEHLWRQQLIVKRTRRWSPLAWTKKGYSVIRVQGPKSPGRTLWSWLEAQRRGRCWPSPETTWAERGRETYPGFLLSSALPPALCYCPSRVRNLLARGLEVQPTGDNQVIQKRTCWRTTGRNRPAWAHVLPRGSRLLPESSV